MGRRIETRIDTKKLSQTERTRLEKLVSPLEGTPKRELSQGKDVFQYTVTIDGSTEREWTFDDLTLPDSCRPLIEFLQENAKPIG